jgi:hypothetical protein
MRRIKDVENKDGCFNGVRAMRVATTPDFMLVAALAVTLTGCATLPPQIAKSEGKVRVQGTRNSAKRVFIRTLDGGDILWVGGYKLGSEAWLSPGPHRIETSCEFLYSWGTKIFPGNVIEIDVESGMSYHLDGAISQDGERCDVSLRERA